jgi:hypothetical protein
MNTVELKIQAQTPPTPTDAAPVLPYKKLSETALKLLTIERELTDLSRGHGDDTRLSWRLESAASEVARAVDRVNEILQIKFYEVSDLPPTARFNQEFLGDPAEDR